MAFIAAGSYCFGGYGGDPAFAFRNIDGTNPGQPDSAPVPFDGFISGLGQRPGGAIAMAGSENNSPFCTYRGFDATFALLACGNNFIDQCVSMSAGPFQTLGRNVGFFDVIQTYDDAGVQTSSVALASHTTFYHSMAMSPDGTIVYLGQSSGSLAIKRYLIGTGYLSDLVTHAAGPVGVTRDQGLLVLGNGNILVSWRGTGGGVSLYNPSGTLLSTYFPTDASPNFFGLLTPSFDDTEFNVGYYRTNTQFWGVERINIATGIPSITIQFDTNEFGFDSPFMMLLEDIGTPGGPLEVVCPDDVAVTEIPPAVVTFPDPAVSGGVPPYVIDVDPPSGSLFAEGDTDVTVTVTDDDLTVVICHFTVTVIPPAPAGDYCQAVECEEPPPPVVESGCVVVLGTGSED